MAKINFLFLILISVFLSFINDSKAQLQQKQNYLLSPFTYKGMELTKDSITDAITSCFYGELIRYSKNKDFNVSPMIEEINEIIEAGEFLLDRTGVEYENIVVDTVDVVVFGKISDNTEVYTLIFSFWSVRQSNGDAKFVPVPKYRNLKIKFFKDELNNICNNVEAFFYNLNVDDMKVQVYESSPSTMNPDSTLTPSTRQTNIPNESDPTINYKDVSIYLSDIRECKNYNISGLSYSYSEDVFKMWFSDYYALYENNVYEHLLYFKLEECVKALSNEGFDNSLNSNIFGNIIEIDSQLEKKFKLFGETKYESWTDNYPDLARNKTVYIRTVNSTSETNLSVWINKKISELSLLKSKNIDKMANYMSNFCSKRISLPNNWFSYTEDAKIDWLENNIEKFKECKYDKFRY